MQTRTFSVTVHRVGDVRVVAPAGDIDLASADRVRAALAGDGPVALDLSAVPFLDTSGLHVVLEQQRRADEEGHAFGLVAGSDEVQRLFEITGLMHRLTFVRHPSELADGGPG